MGKAGWALAFIGGAIALTALTMLGVDWLLRFLEHLPAPVSSIAKVVFAAAFLALLAIISRAFDREEEF
jgi:hypothetical protein